MNIQRNATLLSLWLITVSACVDDDVQIAQLAASRNQTDITACVDILGGCSLQNQLGEALRTICCQTCADDNDTSNMESDLPGTDETIQIYLLGGQSECVGQGKVADLDADSATYPELQGDIPGVWFAGYSSQTSFDSFFIAPMNGGDVRSLFGPEISFGERMYAVTGKRTLVMKYCVGGTNVHSQWNPETVDNSWDKNSDDGTAQWMADNAGLDFSSKFHLYKNMIYTVRRTTEALSEGGVPYEWAGIVWVQGQSDLEEGDPVWKAFGENTARVWNGFRDEIGSDDLVPIIDTGYSSHNQLKSGKEYATQIVCNAKNIEFALVSNDDKESDCQTGPNNPCFESPNMHPNLGVFAHYGFDPNMIANNPEFCASSECNEFHWFSSYPVNVHSAYEGMILKGRMLANRFIQEFTDFDLPSDFADSDPSLLFPLPACPEGDLPSEGNFCWIDYRDESMMVELCTESSSRCNGDLLGDELSSSSSTYNLCSALVLIGGFCLFSIL